MPADPPLTVYFRQLTPESAIVGVCGEVAADTTSVLATALEHAILAYPRVTCDLSGVTFFGAAGANATTLTRARGRARGHRLELAGVRGTARDVLLIVGLGPMLRISGLLRVSSTSCGRCRNDSGLPASSSGAGPRAVRRFSGQHHRLTTRESPAAARAPLRGIY
ncbi:STAS domain-containing protein [Actinoplanes sp. NPDC020271]|uniref:STAS domain-containing protein n=1 Tax=Actinoplanes sp. NPDC020271 TaxID=3363896 RepID=UPI0037B8FA92